VAAAIRTVMAVPKTPQPNSGRTITCMISQRKTPSPRPFQIVMRVTSAAKISAHTPP
jgi:hypothetical protein